MATATHLPPLVVITGAYGFVGAHACRQALARGYRVRGSVRNHKFEAALRNAVAPHQANLELVVLDLDSRQEQWNDALDGATYCLHLASPVLVHAGNQDDETLLRPTVEGTARIVHACAKTEGFRLFVFCGSIQAVNSGHPAGKATFSEADWTPDGCKLRYGRAKMKAECAAWRLSQELDVPMVSVLPTPILGPSLLARVSPCSEAVQKIAQREVPFIPNMFWNAVDVRDVVDLHLAAVEASAGTLSVASTSTVGRRLIADAGETIPFPEFAALCQEALGPSWNVITTRGPDWLFWLVSFFDPRIAIIMPHVRARFVYDTKLSTALLASYRRSAAADNRLVSREADTCEERVWRDPRRAVSQTAASMLHHGLLDARCKTPWGAVRQNTRRLVHSLAQWFCPARFRTSETRPMLA